MFCFSSNCTAATGDTIQFIQLKENCNKHEALLKATAMIEGCGSSNLLFRTAVPQQEEAKLYIASAPLEKIAVVAKLFGYPDIYIANNNKEYVSQLSDFEIYTFDKTGTIKRK